MFSFLYKKSGMKSSSIPESVYLKSIIFMSTSLGLYFGDKYGCLVLKIIGDDNLNSIKGTTVVFTMLVFSCIFSIILV